MFFLSFLPFLELYERKKKSELREVGISQSVCTYAGVVLMFFFFSSSVCFPIRECCVVGVMVGDVPLLLAYVERKFY